MRQRTYVTLGGQDVGDAAAACIADAKASDAQSQLVFGVEASCDPKVISRRMAALRDAVPGLHVVGSTKQIVDSFRTPAQLATVHSLLQFDTSDVTVAWYDYETYSLSQAAWEFLAKMEGVEDVRAVLILTANASVPCNEFLSIVSGRMPDVTLFGMQAGTPIMGDDRSLIFADGHVSHDALVAVAFSGRDLHAHDCYSFGFRSLGSEHTITGVNGTLATTIDGKPAVDLYGTYLDIDPEPGFYENVCAFPLVADGEGLPVAHVATGYTDAGAMTFSLGFQTGDKVSLAYSKPSYVLAETLAEANGLKRFCPQATVVVTCINRRIFLGDADEERELGYFAESNNHMVYTSGYGELYHRNGAGGVLNSTLIALGLREGPAPEDGFCPIVDEELEKSSEVTLSDRLVTLLEATSEELRQTISNLRVLSTTDDLTEIANRRKTMAYLESLVNRRAENEAIDVVMFDIDGFKGVNDNFGHEVGDEVLREVVRRVKNCIRVDDLLGRWGGDEFLVIARGLAERDLIRFGERVRQAVAASPIEAVGRTTISVGVTTVRAGDTSELVFDRVDKALYDAKAKGRNCVSAA